MASFLMGASENAHPAEYRGQPVALCEAAMIPIGLLRWQGLLRRRSTVWYIDNTSAMALFLKGASNLDSRILDSGWGHIWLEWVDSESNWFDGISRE